MRTRFAVLLSLAAALGGFAVSTFVPGEVEAKKAKAAFGGKIKMLGREDVESLTGHPVGGVCPFGLAQPLPVFCDVSLKDFDFVIPAAGATNAAVKVSPQRMAEITAAEWVDVCQPPQAEG